MITDLVRLLVDRYELEVKNPGEYEYVSVNDIAELQYEIEEGDLIDGPVPVTLRVLEQGTDYSEVDPDTNPMSFVIEFLFPGLNQLRYLEVYGHYVSHDGGYWDGYHEVRPKTVTVITFQ